MLPLLLAAVALWVPDWHAQRYLVLYLAPLASAFLLWLRLRLLCPVGARRSARILDAGVVAVAALRAVTDAIPLSGHMLFLVYSGLTTRGWAYPLLAVLLVAETTVFKLLVWNDPASWALGGFAGLLAAVAHRRLR